MEDAVAEAERTKAAVYRTHTFFTVYAVSATEDSESTLTTHRISGFVLPRGLITVRLSPHFDIDVVSQRFDELGGQEYGVAYPGIETVGGFVTSTAIIAALVVLLYVMFKRRDWL